MAYFAKLDKNNVVLEVNLVNDTELLQDGVESETKGVEFLVDWSGGYSNWKQTSYNGNFRKNYAGIGYTYDSARDAFIPPQPFPSWTLNEDTCLWDAPTPMPTDGQRYQWNEPTTSWVAVPTE
tara:strand:+ start:1032 stop:1400 length:369 start_codon:yes stop_codon:yes gene_type:complete